MDADWTDGRDLERIPAPDSDRSPQSQAARHHRLHSLAIETFFCDPYAPWQKGGVENAIGRLRRPLPRKTDLANIDLGTLNACVTAYNNTPRKCLGYKSPAQAFRSQLLHFKCESTSRLSPA